ncbi:MAG TPA: type II toxin-antitoxin system RelE/ParE family toxin [Verrucomicrobiae bacterium]|jgi:phage-related protein
MNSERPLNIVFYQTGTGHEPAREWLKSLPKEERKTIGADILSVQYAWPVGKPLVDNLGDGVWEIRSQLPNRIARTLFAVVNEEIVLLHGFIKKQQQTPAQELTLAKRRKREYLQNL